MREARTVQAYTCDLCGARTTVHDSVELWNGSGEMAKPEGWGSYAIRLRSACDAPHLEAAAVSAPGVIEQRGGYSLLWFMEDLCDACLASAGEDLRGAIRQALESWLEARRPRQVTRRRRARPLLTMPEPEEVTRGR